jgi:iterative type I PKS product template protein
MTIQKALILKSSGPQPLQTIVTVDWASKNAKCRFVSYDAQGGTPQEHSHCTIQFTDRSGVAELEKKRAEIQQRAAAMRKSPESGKTQRFNRTMVYKMIGPLAKFHRDYQGIDEVIIDSNTLEAASRVNFKDVKVGGTFHTHPAYIDGLTQSAGFVMNCNDHNDLDVEVFVNHGWKSLQLYESLSPEKTYSTWLQMVEAPNRMYEGDIVIYDGDAVVASYQGIVVGTPDRFGS